jgi:hypothetical protein
MSSRVARNALSVEVVRVAVWIAAGAKEIVCLDAKRAVEIDCQNDFQAGLAVSFQFGAQHDRVRMSAPVEPELLAPALAPALQLWPCSQPSSFSNREIASTVSCPPSSRLRPDSSYSVRRPE